MLSPSFHQRIPGEHRHLLLLTGFPDDGDETLVASCILNCWVELLVQEDDVHARVTSGGDATPKKRAKRLLAAPSDRIIRTDLPDD